MQALEKELCTDHGKTLPVTEALAWIAYDENPRRTRLNTRSARQSFLWIYHRAVRIIQKLEISALNTHLYDTLGFSGDKESCHDPKNARLDKVISRRKGLPIMLSVIYMELGKKADFP